MTLVEFLLARIKEDEAFGTHDRHLAGRWGAECEAKRLIVKNHHYFQSANHAYLEQSEMTLRLMASPHHNHADYQQEWAA